MGKVKFIQGNVSEFENLTEPLFEGAASFFGPKYEKVLNDTLSHLYFYEQQEGESKKDALEELTGQLIMESENPFDEEQEKMIALHILYEKDSQHQDQIILYKKAPLALFQKALAKEIFGHAVCGHLERAVTQNDQIYYRNGILLENEYEALHKISSEGFMELIAYEVLEKAGVSLTPEMVNLPYLIAYGNAKFVYDEIGHQAVMNHLIFNQGNLMEEFNRGMKEDYFHILEKSSLINFIEKGTNVVKRCQDNEEIQFQYIKEKRRSSKSRRKEF